MFAPMTTTTPLQQDLFARPPLPGLRLSGALLSTEEEALLIAHIDALDLSPFRFQQWTGKRLTQSFGWRYDFENGHFGPADPLPTWLEDLRNRAANFAGLPGRQLEQALVTRYDRGAGIGWHRDRPMFEHVVGVSLGEPAVLRFRRRKTQGFDRASVPLSPRTAYHMSGEARHGWEHSITPMAAPRWSITFRTLAQGRG